MKEFMSYLIIIAIIAFIGFICYMIVKRSGGSKESIFIFPKPLSYLVKMLADGHGKHSIFLMKENAFENVAAVGEVNSIATSAEAKASDSKSSWLSISMMLTISWPRERAICSIILPILP